MTVETQAFIATADAFSSLATITDRVARVLRDHRPIDADVVEQVDALVAKHLDAVAIVQGWVRERAADTDRYRQQRRPPEDLS